MAVAQSPGVPTRDTELSRIQHGPPPASVAPPSRVRDRQPSSDHPQLETRNPKLPPEAPMPNTRITLETQLADVRIHEADGQLANGGHVVEVTLIKAGTSSNGNHYSDDLLRHSAALFEGTRAFADHSGPLDRKERSVRDLVGHYRNSRYEMSPAGGRVRAD